MVIKLFIGLKLLFFGFLVNFVDGDEILCENGFCRSYGFEPGCADAAPHCGINNATHSGLWLPSPTLCNCCEYCLPFYGENEHCSQGGPGTGTTVGRCGSGLTCTAQDDGDTTCQRMESECHSHQDDFDARHEAGQVGALEYRPICDDKGRFGTYHCVPTQTCYCQSEEGDRIFGEVLYLGSATNMNCGCSRLHEKISRNIQPSVPYPVAGPRCTSDGNFNPVQCSNRVCYCVDRITGRVMGNESVDLDEIPITELSCYDPTLEFYPSQSHGDPPYNFTTPCLDRVLRDVAVLQDSIDEGFNVDYFSGLSGCLPDGSFGRVSERNESKICVDERGQQIGDYAAVPGSPGYDDMDCKCALTTSIMTSSPEKPVCCANGNFRRIQCRRGTCRCVDQDGRQIGLENSDVTLLTCYHEEWRDC